MPGADALAGGLVRKLGTRASPMAAFYLSPMRFWELGVGCLLALTKLRARYPVVPLVIILGGLSVPQEMAESLPGGTTVAVVASILDPHSDLCRDGLCAMYLDGKQLYGDLWGHFPPSNPAPLTEFFKRWLDNQINLSGRAGDVPHASTDPTFTVTR